MGLLWIVSLIKKEADIVDAGWAFSTGIASLVCAYFGDGDLTRRIALACITGAWSLRLSHYLFTTRVMHPGEDGRYVALRESWGAQAWWKFFLFFEMQALLVVFLALPFFIIAYTAEPIAPLALSLALLIGIVSIVGETIADRQLLRFKAHPENKGQVCSYGLWRYSRHPNYFFEWLHWVAYIPLAWGSPLFIGAPISAIVLYILVTRVTGIPPTEARALESRPVTYKEYQRVTSPFFPLPPRRDG
jgi:steroid 5-alpha reductase family enzyme